METDQSFDITTTVEDNHLLIKATGHYSLTKANNLFKLAIDDGLLHNKNKVLIDITEVTGYIPFFDRFYYSEFLSEYRIKHALGKVDRIAVIGHEPIVHEQRFGETVAINRGTPVRVFTDMNEALAWINKK